MSHKQTKSQISSREGYELYSPQVSITVSGSSYVRRAIGLSLFVLGIAVSFLTGRYYLPYNRVSSEYQPNIDLPLHKHTFIFNQTFVDSGPAAEEAWKSLFPSQGGFFRHPTISRDRANFAVFHQLHCLEKIRETYWVLYDGSVAARDGAPATVFDPDNVPFYYTPPHIGHCVELIRNALICRPDTTLEIKDLEIGGVTGFDAEHFCVNWDQLVEWVSQWENYGKNNPKTREASTLHKGAGSTS